MEKKNNVRVYDVQMHAVFIHGRKVDDLAMSGLHNSYQTDHRSENITITDKQQDKSEWQTKRKVKVNPTDPSISIIDKPQPDINSNSGSATQLVLVSRETSVA
jgi:hypothetical protein